MEECVLTQMKDGAGDYLGSIRRGMGGEPVSTPMSQQEALKLYRFDWLARNIVDMYAEDMTAAGVKWLCDAETAKFLESRFRRYHVWEVLTDAIRWSRLFGGSLICIDMADQLPSERLNPAGDILGFRVFSRWEAVANTQTLDTDRLGEPSSYDISPRVYQQTFKLDCSRAIRFTGAKVPNEQLVENQLWGDSILNALKTPIERYNSAMQSTDELLKRCYLRYLGLQNFWQGMSDKEGAESIANAAMMINEVQNISGLTIADSGDTFSTQQYGFSGIKDVLMSMSQDNAGAAGVPLVRLFGMSPAGFSTGDADLRNYYDNVKRAQEAKLREPIQRIAKLILTSERPNVDASEIDFEFLPVMQPTEVEKQQATQAAVASIMQVYEGGLITADKALEEIRRQAETSGLFASVTDDDVKRLKEPDVPMPDLSQIDLTNLNDAV